MRSKIDPNITDEDLVQQCLADKRQYQEFLYRRYADYMYTVALTYSSTEQEACDILQEGFIKVFRYLPKFKFRGSLKSWIRRTVINTALDHYRSKKRRRENFENYQHTIELKVDTIVSKISAKELVQLVNKLPERAGLVLKLYAIEGFSHKEIADQLDISENTSKSQLHRARNLLKGLIAKINGSTK